MDTRVTPACDAVYGAGVLREVISTMRNDTRAAKAMRHATHHRHPGQASIASASRDPVHADVGWLAHCCRNTQQSTGGICHHRFRAYWIPALALLGRNDSNGWKAGMTKGNNNSGVFLMVMIFPSWRRICAVSNHKATGRLELRGLILRDAAKRPLLSDCLGGQAFCHGRLSLRIALRMVSSFLATAISATIFGLPAPRRR